MYRTATTLALAVVLALAGCGGNDAERDTSDAPVLPSTSAAAPSTEAAVNVPVRSDRGNIVKALGEEGGFGAPEDTARTGPLVLSFTVDAITPGVDCNSGFASPPDNGNFIGIDLRVATSPEYPSDMFTTFTAADFSVVGPDGITVSDVQGMASMCLGPNGFTYEPLGPGQQYTGTVVIDSPVTSGVLVYAPMGRPTGWEWQF